jgi:hypothetical protein
MDVRRMDEAIRRDWPLLMITARGSIMPAIRLPSARQITLERAASAKDDRRPPALIHIIAGEWLTIRLALRDGIAHWSNANPGGSALASPDTCPNPGKIPAARILLIRWSRRDSVSAR